MQLVECKACGSRELIAEQQGIVCAYCQAVYVPDGDMDKLLPSAPAEIQKTSFDVILRDPGKNKIDLIKTVRKLNGSGLKEAKDVVESCPQPVVSGVSRSAAEAAKVMLEGCGAQVEVV